MKARTLWRFVPILTLCLVAGMFVIGCVGTALHGRANPAQPPEIGIELVQVKAADGVLLDGALWNPGGEPGSKAALLLIHGSAGNFSTGWPRLARSLAEKGHLTLALNMRDHELTPQTSMFEDNRLDFEAGGNLGQVVACRP